MTDNEAALREAMVRLRELELRIAALEAKVGSSYQLATSITSGN
jgi:hypothetical protein